MLVSPWSCSLDRPSLEPPDTSRRTPRITNTSYRGYGNNKRECQSRLKNQRATYPRTEPTCPKRWCEATRAAEQGSVGAESAIHGVADFMRVMTITPHEGRLRWWTTTREWEERGIYGRIKHCAYPLMPSHTSRDGITRLHGRIAVHYLAIRAAAALDVLRWT